MSTYLDVALLQLEAAGRDQAANVERGVDACRRAKAMGAHVALFPEMWSIGYDLREGAGPPEELQAHATTIDGPFVTTFATLARELELAIAITFLERWPDRPRNTVAVFDRHGDLVLVYAKVHTCDWDTEARLTPGDDFPVGDLETQVGTVSVGAMICFDALFPESARVLMLRGAELILVPNASDYPPWRQAVLQTRAIENMVDVAMANYPGETQGSSCAFDPIPFREAGDEEITPRDPTVVLAGPEPGIHLARFDLDRLRRFRERETQGDAFRKPSTYGALVSGEVRPPFVRAAARR